MQTVSASAKRHPLLTYYILTFAISWGAMLAVILAQGIPTNADEDAAVLPVAIAGMLAGPSLAAILSTALVEGRAGLRQLFSRLRPWAVGWRWYMFALLIGPVVWLAVGLVLSLRSTVFLPGILTSGDGTGLLLAGIMAGVFVGIFEELGWTGFVLPRLRSRHGILITGLIIGVLWGAWHIMANGVLSIYTAAGTLSPATFLAARGVEFMIGFMPALRILMVWIYDRTASLSLAMLMHASYTAGALILTPLGLVGGDLLIHEAVLGAAMWLVVAAVVRAARGTLQARRPSEGRAS